MNFQTLIYSILACLVLFLAMLVIIVVFVGILRIAIISVFEYDFVQAYKKRKALKGIKPFKEQYEDLPRVYNMGLYEGKKDEDI